MSVTVATKSPDDTRELASSLAALVRPGDTILLAGDLGAGKTTFTQGFGRALGVTEPITSPTFTLLRHYPEATPPLLHADVYRIEHLQEVIDLGLGELVDEGAVALIEWGDVAAAVFAPDFLEVRIEFGPDDEERRLRLRAVGQPWSGRMSALAETLARWAA